MLNNQRVTISLPWCQGSLRSGCINRSMSSRMRTAPGFCSAGVGIGGGNINLVGGWPTPLKNDGVRQLGWLFLIYGKNVPNHQPVNGWYESIQKISRNWVTICNYTTVYRQIGHLNSGRTSIRTQYEHGWESCMRMSHIPPDVVIGSFIPCFLVGG